jgi:branched-chain amino acid aminotransferase
VIVHLNGRWLEHEAAAIPITDRGFLTGDGVFETARLHRGAYFRLDRHIDRLRTSGALMRIAVPEPGALTAIADGLAARNAFREGSLRITITRGAGERAGTLLGTLAPIADDWQAKADRGWHVVTAAVRRPPVSSVPADIKGIGRPYALLARLEADAAGADDALLLNHEGFITEGPTWNVFWRHGRTLATPGLPLGVLGGITRAVVMDAAASLGYDVVEVAHTPAVLATADEVFATMSSVGVVPIRRLDGRDLPGEHTAAHDLQRAYWHTVARECARE